MSNPPKIRIYLEGGRIREANRSDIDVLKRSFSIFFKQMLSRPPEVVPKGDGGKAVSNFSGEVRYGDTDVVLLLVDSEGPAPMPDQMSFKDYLSGRRAKNSRLFNEAEEDQIFLMVQCMEAWFLADKENLARYYRRGGNQFDPGDLPPKGDQSVEDVPCNQIQASINKALAKADAKKRRRRKYLKSHGFEIVAYLDPHKVAAASPHAKRLFDALTQLSGK